MQKLEEGRLVHGLLLGWAVVMGDRITPFRTAATETPYMMPMREGMTFAEYPWMQHGIQNN